MAGVHIPRLVSSAVSGYWEKQFVLLLLLLLLLLLTTAVA